MRGLHPSLKRRANWEQLIKFSLVGSSGYVVNLGIFAVSTQTLSINYRIAAVIAFCFAVTNNFLINRHWTFQAHDGHAGFQAARFFIVSLIGLLINLVLLEIFVSSFGISEVLAQAIAIVIATPLSFVGNKLWSFKI